MPKHLCLSFAATASKASGKVEDLDGICHTQVLEGRPTNRVGAPPWADAKALIPDLMPKVPTTSGRTTCWSRIRLNS